MSPSEQIPPTYQGTLFILLRYGYNPAINTSGLQPPNTFSSGINNVPVTVNTSNVGG